MDNYLAYNNEVSIYVLPETLKQILDNIEKHKSQGFELVDISINRNLINDFFIVKVLMEKT